MESRVARINGVKTHLERMTDDELEAAMGYAHDRIESNVRDLEALGIESARRYGEAALQDTVEIPVIEDPNQGKLFHFPVRSDLPDIPA